MSRKALLICDFDEEKINAGQLYNNNGCTIIPLTYGKKYESCYVQLPIFIHQFELIEHKYYDELLLMINETNKDELNQLIEKLDKKIINIINEKKAIESIFDGYTKIKYKNIIRMKDSSPVIKLKIDHNTIFRKRTNIDDINYLANHPTFPISKNELNIGDNYRCIIQVSSIWISENVFGVYMRPLIIEKLELATIDFQEISRKPNYNNPLSSEDRINSNQNSNQNSNVDQDQEISDNNEFKLNSKIGTIDINKLEDQNNSDHSSQIDTLVESLIDSV